MVPSDQPEQKIHPIFVKLGGSLITDKRRPETPRMDVIQQLAREIASARRQHPRLRLVLGHGSGSFGHVAGQQYGTRHGVRSSDEWFGFAATADAAARLNRIVVSALLQERVPVWTIQPSVDLRCSDGNVLDGPAETVKLALSRGLVPMIHGDVALDDVRGGTIASTEEIFDWLADHLTPRRIVLAGEVDGVYTDDPQKNSGAQRIDSITPASLQRVISMLGSSLGADVTGGMAAKVKQAVRMVQRHPQMKVIICTGRAPGSLRSAMTEVRPSGGTVIKAN